jgi:hypothetical protein
MIPFKVPRKKYSRLDEMQKPNKVIARTEKSIAQIVYQMKTGHALIGPHLRSGSENRK